MDHLDIDIEKKIFSYSYSKNNNLIAYSHKKKNIVFHIDDLSLIQFYEISRYLSNNFDLIKIGKTKFNEYLTKTYSADGFAADITNELDENFDLETYAQTLSQTEDLLNSSNDTPIIKLINGIVSRAINEKVSDVHFEVDENNLYVRFRNDGIMNLIIKQDTKISPLIVSRIKIMSKLDISERRLPQDGRMSLSLGSKKIDVRVSTLPSRYGERVVLRILDKESSQIDIEELGFESKVLKNYKNALKSSEGLILFTGPTGSGKTTTLYAGLNYISDDSQNILTIEDPIEYSLKGIGQTQVNQKTGYTFANGLRALLRQDPDIIMIGEMRDLETAEIAIQSSLTGHLVLSTVHTNSAISAITRLRDMGIESYLIASSIKAIFSQRLIRKLCDECKMESSTTIDNSLVDFDSSIKTYTAKGCSHCKNTGYKGRVALAESVIIDDALKKMIHEQRSENEMLKHISLKGDSIEFLIKRLLIDGVTSIEEIIRVNNFN